MFRSGSTLCMSLRTPDPPPSRLRLERCRRIRNLLLRLGRVPRTLTLLPTTPLSPERISQPDGGGDGTRTNTTLRSSPTHPTPLLLLSTRIPASKRLMRSPLAGHVCPAARNLLRWTTILEATGRGHCRIFFSKWAERLQSGVPPFPRRLSRLGNSGTGGALGTADAPPPWWAPAVAADRKMAVAFSLQQHGIRLFDGLSLPPALLQRPGMGVGCAIATATWVPMSPK